VIVRRWVLFFLVFGLSGALVWRWRSLWQDSTVKSFGMNPVFLMQSNS